MWPGHRRVTSLHPVGQILALAAATLRTDRWAKTTPTKSHAGKLPNQGVKRGIKSQLTMAKYRFKLRGAQKLRAIR